jgi:hypothetical protein
MLIEVSTCYLSLGHVSSGKDKLGHVRSFL